MVFIIMTLYNAYDLGIVRALCTIWLMFITRDYTGYDVENRVRRQPHNGQDNTHLSPRTPSAPPLSNL